MDPHTHTLETDGATDGDVVAALQHVCALGAATSSEGSSMASPKSVGRSGVNAIFRTGTGLRYPVWRVILDFAKCYRHLKVATTHRSERSVVILQVNSETNSEWLGLCPDSEWLGLCLDLVHLPRFLAKYVGARFHASHSQKVPDPNGLLAHREIATMVNMVQVVSSTRAEYSGARPGTIAPFNVLAIRHPAMAGQVRSHPPC